MELLKKRTGVEKKLFELALKVTSESDLELYDAEYITGSSTFRVFIMDGNTKTAVIEDCVKVDRAFNPACEEESWIPDNLVLEVSSPGVYRPLKTKAHFEQAVDQIVLVILEKPLESEQYELKVDKKKPLKQLRGKLIRIFDDAVVIYFKNCEIKLLYSQIKKANLDPDFNS